jgi:hypothetical protein
MIGPFLVIAAGAATLFWMFAAKENDVPPVHEPDEAPTPGTTGYKRVDAILDELKKAAQASGIPLGVIVGWIAKESGGRLDDVTKYDERGYFQLMPDESKTIGYDHQRLSTDPVYSINAGLALIGKYMGDVDKFAVAPRGSSYYWRLVKLAHSMGSGAVKKIIDEAKAAGAAGSWESLERYATANDSHFLSTTKHSPIKWFPFVDTVYNVGAPFGFGTSDQVVGGIGADPLNVYTDIVDPLDCLKKR